MSDPIYLHGEAADTGPAGRTERLVLTLILTAGALIRLGLWATFQGVVPHVVDEQQYSTLAVNLARHGEFSYTPGEATSLRSPLYPAAISVVYQLFGAENYQSVRLCQAALSLVTVLVLYRLAAEAYPRRIGLWLAGLYAFYPTLLGFNNMILSEGLFTTLLCTACLELVRALRRRSLIALAFGGVLLGLASLTRSVLWVFPPVLSVFLLAAWPGSPARRLAAVVVAFAAFAVTVAPWSVRNTRLEKTFIVIDSYGGRNLMLGNYEYTPLLRSWDAVSIEGEHSWHQVLARSEPSFARATQGQRDKLAMRRAIRYAAGHPGLTLERVFVRFLNFWGLERELLAAAGHGYFGTVSRPLFLLLTLVIFGGYTLAMITGVVGAILTPPDDRRVHGLILLIIGFICGLHTLSQGHSRYHAPIMPLVLLYSAAAMDRAPALWASRRRRAFPLACTAVAALVAVWIWEIVIAYGQCYWMVLHA
jgi:4-amino-4-deoxy-L-arabinose transferase-like glycosyltransferase